MNQKPFFIIDNNELSIEQVLVEYENEPIFFVCKDKKTRYLSVCRDIDKESYLLTKISNSCLLKMLRAKISMRKAITDAYLFWDITLGETYQDDIVVSKSISEIPVEDLPYEGACYQITTHAIEDYVKKIESSVYKEAVTLNQVAIKNLHIENIPLLESFQKEKIQTYWQILQCGTQKCRNTTNAVQLNEQDVYKHVTPQKNPASKAIKQHCIVLAA